MLVAAPHHPPSFSTQTTAEESPQYRPPQDFKSLLPPIEFVEGSSSGGFAVPEGKYTPINGTPKASKVAHSDNTRSTPLKSPATPLGQTPNGKTATTLHSGAIDTTWPPNSRLGQGLHNNGNTCFLNSVLQCLLHTPPLLRILQAHNTHSDPCRVKESVFCMTCRLREVMLFSNKVHHAFIPSVITSNLKSIAKHMRLGRQEDAHEFLRYAVDGFQKSCLAGHPPKLDAKIAETSWVHKLFGGRLRSRVTCRVCRHNSDTYDSILDLSLDIFKQATIQGALKSFVKMETLKDSNMYKCDKCKKPVIADKHFTIHDAPVVLTVHLKRFSPLGRKLTHPIAYGERLSLQDAMSKGQFGPSYSLYGVICHAGSGPNSGHYYAIIKDPKGRWVEMNDESVAGTRAPVDRKNAYMLYYIRDKGQALEAAVNGTAQPNNKNGVVSGMKKRKAADDEGGSVDMGVKTSRPFIGPQLPSPSPVTTPNTSHSRTDPQADAVKKKIAAVASASQALQSLSQYSDDDEDDQIKTHPAVDEKAPPTDSLSTSDVRSSPPGPPTSPSTPTPSVVPTGNFYNKPSQIQSDRTKKRKSPDEDGDENRSTHKKLQSSPISAASPHFRHKNKKFKRSGNRDFNRGSNFYDRGGGNNNLFSGKNSNKPPITYKSRPRPF